MGNNKIYKIRKLNGGDFFLFAKLFNKMSIDKLYDLFSNLKSEVSQQALGMAIFVTAFKTILNDILCNSENDILELLESISNLSSDEIKKLSIADFGDMVMDVIENEDVQDFINRMYSRGKKVVEKIKKKK